MTGDFFLSGANVCWLCRADQSDQAAYPVVDSHFIEGKLPVIIACLFHFRLLQSLRMYELLRPLLHIFQLRGVQLDEDRDIFFTHFQPN